ncbi:MAG TPA: CoA-binding protein [Methylomirabilota bacterium]|nr:CoA-binding protein [Methylomirabilota bacterium]
MPTPQASLDSIHDFLAQKRLAIVGISHDAHELSVMLFKEFSKRGYEVVPVNPNLPAVSGHKCYARVQDIEPPVNAALLMTSPQVTDTVVQDCAEAGIHRVWMYRGGGKGAVSPKAIEFCRQHGISVIPGECPYMFLPQSGGIHSFHGFLRKLFGSYPKHFHGSPSH